MPINPHLGTTSAASADPAMVNPAMYVASVATMQAGGNGRVFCGHLKINRNNFLVKPLEKVKVLD